MWRPRPYFAKKQAKCNHFGVWFSDCHSLQARVTLAAAKGILQNEANPITSMLLSIAGLGWLRLDGPFAFWPTR
jgi:hypothetical protein